LPGHVVVPRLKPAVGIRPASRLVASQNLSPRHLLLFMRWLLGESWVLIRDRRPALVGLRRGRLVPCHSFGDKLPI
jgi:hypothetical protein